MADLLTHRWVPDTHGRDACDHKGDDDGQRRTCGRPAREHLDQLPIGSLPEKMPEGLTVKREGPYVEKQAMRAWRARTCCCSRRTRRWRSRGRSSWRCTKPSGGVMGERSKLDGCHRRCWNTGSQLFHAPGCVNETFSERVPIAPVLRNHPSLSRMAREAIAKIGNARSGPAEFASDVERDWYEHATANRHSPAEQALRALVTGQAISGQRLVWAYEHSKRGSVVKELLGARLRMVLGLAAGVPLEREAAHG